MKITSKTVVIFFKFLLVNGQHNPNFKDNRRGIVQLFEWRFEDIARECETFLAKHRFAGVQVNIFVMPNPFTKPVHFYEERSKERDGVCEFAKSRKRKLLTT